MGKKLHDIWEEHCVGIMVGIVGVCVIIFFILLFRPTYGKVYWGLQVLRMLFYVGMFLLFRDTSVHEKKSERIFLGLGKCWALLFLMYLIVVEGVPAVKDIAIGPSTVDLKPGKYSTFEEEVEGYRGTHTAYYLKCNIDGEEWTFSLEYEDFAKAKKKDKKVKIKYYKYSELVDKIDFK